MACIRTRLAVILERVKEHLNDEGVFDEVNTVFIGVTPLRKVLDPDLIYCIINHRDQRLLDNEITRFGGEITFTIWNWLGLDETGRANIYLLDGSLGLLRKVDQVNHVMNGLYLVDDDANPICNIPLTLTDMTEMIPVTDFEGWGEMTLIYQIEWSYQADTLDQIHYRGRNDDGDEITATWKAAEDTTWIQTVDVNFRVRFSIDEIKAVKQENVRYRLQYNKNKLGWFDVTTTSDVVKATASVNPGIADGDPTTTQLTAAGLFVAGEFSEDALTDQITLLPTNYTELEYCLQIDSDDVEDEDIVELRVSRNGGTPSSTVPVLAKSFYQYTEGPTITVNDP